MSVPATTICPVVGLSMPATRLSSVLLPEPLAPMSDTKSRASTSRLTLWSGTIFCSPLRYSLVTPRISSSAMAPSTLSVSPCARRQAVAAGGLVGDPRAGFALSCLHELPRDQESQRLVVAHLGPRRGRRQESHLHEHVGPDCRGRCLDRHLDLQGVLLNVGLRRGEQHHPV